MSVAIQQVWVLRAIIAVCALMGLSRGVVREIPTLAGVVLAPLVAPVVADLLPRITGQPAPAAVKTAAAATQAAAAALGGQELLGYLVVVAAGYVVGSLLIHGHSGFVPKLLGLVLGGLNGYLISQYALPRLFPAAKTTVVVTGQAIRAVSTASSTGSGIVVVAVVMVVAGLGVWAASGRTKAG